jgi:hypothetical protein
MNFETTGGWVSMSIDPFATTRKESRGNTGAVESVESRKQASHSFHEPLGNLAKIGRDSHIPTAPAKRADGKVENQKQVSHFPTAPNTYLSKANTNGGRAIALRPTRRSAPLGQTTGDDVYTKVLTSPTAWDEEGHPIREPDSTTYTGAIETAEEFGKRLYLEAWKRGWGRAEKKVAMGDGAEWIWNLAKLHFPGAIQIVDLYHARQHLWELIRKLHPNNEASQKAWIRVHQKLLDKGKIEKLVLAIRSIHSTNPEVADKIRTEADYFETNAERMRYPEFRKQHLFVGSGVIEAGCKTVIGSRLKRSGMFWTVRGANAILALRCCHLNGRFEDYWEARRVA